MDTKAGLYLEKGEKQNTNLESAHKNGALQSFSATIWTPLKILTPVFLMRSTYMAYSTVVFLVWQSLSNLGHVFKVNISGILEKNTKFQSARGWNSRSDYLCTRQKCLVSVCL